MMTLPKAIFISNRKYVDEQSPEGGVKFCTAEYLELLSSGFELSVFPIDIDLSLQYRIQKKLGIAVYAEYNPPAYRESISKLIKDKGIEFVFLNLTNTIKFARQIKEDFPAMKIILCSHGNESGDFLHEVKQRETKGLATTVGYFALGKMLATEARYRVYIDFVLTVSEVEVMIERWLGAQAVQLISRHIPEAPLQFNPIPGRIGFFGDLTHPPNFEGLKKLCSVLSRLNTREIALRLVGAPESRAQELARQYHFIQFLGYLPEADLRREVQSWTFALNPVFYYSRGVSTKLGKALGWNLPVITTKKGRRGYVWQAGEMLICEGPDEMAELIVKKSFDLEQVSYYREQIEFIRASAPAPATMLNELKERLRAHP